MMAGLTCISPVISCPSIVIPRKTISGLRTGENLPQVFLTDEEKSNKDSTRQSARWISSGTFSRRVLSAGVRLSTGQGSWRSSPVISSKKSFPKGINVRAMVTSAAGVASGVASASILSGLACCGGIAGKLNWLGGGGGFGGGGGSDGGGGGKGGEIGGNWWESLINGPMAIAAEESEGFDSHGLRVGRRVDVSKLDPRKKYKVTGVEMVDKRSRQPVDSKDSMYENMTFPLALRPGGILTKSQLESDVEKLLNSGMFQSVEMDGVTQADGSLKVRISVEESLWPLVDSFKCVNVGLLSQSPSQSQRRLPEGEATMTSTMTDQQREEIAKIQDEEQEKRLKRALERAKPCMLPQNVRKEVFGWLRTDGRVTVRTLHRVIDRLQRWYHEEGYVAAHVEVKQLGNQMVCEVLEGDITKVQIQFLDKMNSPGEGVTKKQIIERELPEQLKPGHLYEIQAARKALQNVSGLGLFSDTTINLKEDEESDGGVIVEVRVKEFNQKRAEVNTNWRVVPGIWGKPTLASIQPGGSVTFEHRNLYGLNRSILGSVSCDNLLNPQEDLGFHAEYIHPYVDGIDDPRNRTFRASCFNSRIQSNVFTGRATQDEVPPIFVERAGIQLNLTEKFTPQTKFTHGLVVEEVTTRDETGAICTNGPRIAPNGDVSMNAGPPTTHSDKGIDRVAYLQGNITRDDTRFVNGTPVGTRNIFQWDQGLGIGSKSPIFNRHQLTTTHFKQLWPEDKKDRNKPPPVLVLHGRYGGCFGDLANYAAYNLGGPYSVRGYNVGELGACRNFLELGTEIRVPVKNTHAYGFLEYGLISGALKM